jgi:hypothetical protein
MLQFEAAKFTTWTPISLLASCRLSLPIIGVKLITYFNPVYSNPTQNITA